MQVRETFYRPQALSREPRRLPAALYNLSFLLRRLQSEFPRALHDLASRRHAVDVPAKPVILHLRTL
jgi:hypothetical protein